MSVPTAPRKSINIVRKAPASRSPFGYLGPWITYAAQSRTHAVACNDKNGVIISQGYPLQLVPRSPTELLEDFKIAASGSSQKAFSTSIMPAAGANLTINLGSVASFGVRIRMTDNPNTFKFGAYKIRLLDGATVLSEVALQANVMPAELLMFGISDAGGQAVITRIANPQILVYGSAAGNPTVSDSTAVFAETLNIRDLGSVVIR